MRRVSLAALTLVFVSSFGCATMKQKESLDALKEAVDEYNHAFRWKNYPEAARFLPVDHRASFIASYEDEAEGIEIEELTIGGVNVINPTYAQVTVRLRYTRLPSITIQKRTATQHWHETEGHWSLENEENSILKPSKKPANEGPTEEEAKEDHEGGSDGFFDGPAPIEPPESESPDTDLLQFPKN
ncbi:MAG: hypothetical protein HYV07_30730 [Deltaproteobacteria bacterium]|nr:hypothetical protein [Deltaproteobacteria bacterium]